MVLGLTDVEANEKRLRGWAVTVGVLLGVWGPRVCWPARGLITFRIHAIKAHEGQALPL